MDESDSRPDFPTASWSLSFEDDDVGEGCFAIIQRGSDGLSGKLRILVEPERENCEELLDFSELLVLFVG